MHSNPPKIHICKFSLKQSENLNLAPYKQQRSICFCFAKLIDCCIHSQDVFPSLPHTHPSSPPPHPNPTFFHLLRLSSICPYNECLLRLPGGFSCLINEENCDGNWLFNLGDDEKPVLIWPTDFICWEQEKAI